MAVFMINICKFNGCGITFPSLGDLIQHIEDTHIDYDPLVIEQKEASQPSCLPLSYVLRFFTEASRREITTITPDIRRKLASVVKTPSVRSNTPTGSEFDEEEMLSGQSEDSNDSWTNVEEFSSEFILRYGSRINATAGNSGQGGTVAEKPFACPVPGCKKRYKNVNGIKYHSKNGHKKDGKVRKGYKCHCGKSYRTAQGLKNHSIAQHFTSQPSSPASTTTAALTPPALTTQTLKPLSLPVVKALQGLVVQSSQNHINTAVNSNSHSRHVTQVMDTAHFENNKVIRAVLENAGNKLSKEGTSTITTLTLPRQNIANLQINVPNVINTTNTINLVHHSKMEHDPSSNMEHKQSVVFKSSHNHVSSESSVSPNSLGVLTPASSPRASPNDKFKQNKDDNQPNQMRVSHATFSASIGGHNLPLTPITPSSEGHTRFTVPNNVAIH